MIKVKLMIKISRELQKKIDRVVKEEIKVVSYDPRWPVLFSQEKKFLLKEFPEVIQHIEHFGSTSIPGLSAKPVIDMLIKVSKLALVKKKIVPKLEALGYDYFWRPESDQPPMYAFFIKRNKQGVRVGHLHIVEASSRLWDRLFFRDYLISHPVVAKKYEELKLKLAQQYLHDRVGYTIAKDQFIKLTTDQAKRYYEM